MSDSYHDVAQICLNGHVITSSLGLSPELGQKFCAQCGATTISACTNCMAQIRGSYHVPGVIGFFEYSKPAYCYNCGNAFPWTTSSLAAAASLADDFEGLTLDEREQLKRTLPDLVRETPNTTVAETRFKKLMKKVGADGYEGMKKILIDVVAEVVKKSL